MQLHRINIATSYQEVFQQLERAILQGNIKIGEPIPTEAELCRMFGVKRSSVREGIRLLEQSGLVARGAARRLIVTAPATGRTSENFIRSATLNSVTLEELWRVERELEALACRLACEVAQPEHLDRLATNIKETRQSAGDPKATTRLDMEFHRLLSQAAGNRALTIARDPLGILLYASTDFLIARLDQSTGRLITAHKNILAAIRAKDVDQAVLWMTRHMDDFKRGCVMSGADFDQPISDFVDHETLAALIRAQPETTVP